MKLISLKALKASQILIYHIRRTLSWTLHVQAHSNCNEMELSKWELVDKSFVVVPLF
jgi:hypothetical protein